MYTQYTCKFTISQHQCALMEMCGCKVHLSPMKLVVLKCVSVDSGVLSVMMNEMTLMLL